MSDTPLDVEMDTRITDEVWDGLEAVADGIKSVVRCSGERLVVPITIPLRDGSDWDVEFVAVGGEWGVVSWWREPEGNA